LECSVPRCLRYSRSSRSTTGSWGRPRIQNLIEAARLTVICPSSIATTISSRENSLRVIAATVIRHALQGPKSGLSAVSTLQRGAILISRLHTRTSERQILAGNPYLIGSSVPMFLRFQMDDLIDLAERYRRRRSTKSEPRRCGRRGQQRLRANIKKDPLARARGASRSLIHRPVRFRAVTSGGTTPATPSSLATLATCPSTPGRKATFGRPTVPSSRPARKLPEEFRIVGGLCFVAPSTYGCGGCARCAQR
jgi:hypothetical protein